MTGRASLRAVPDQPPERRSKPDRFATKRSTTPDMVSLTVRYVVERARRGEISPRTVRDYRSILFGFAKSFGGRDLSHLSPRDVERWMESHERLAPSTRRGYFSAVIGFCDWLVEHRYLKHNPARRLKAPKVPRSVPRALPSAAVAELLRACPDERAKAICWVMVGMGCRCCEVAGLEVGDWDRTAEVMVVTGKAGHQRALPVPPEVARAIDRYLIQYPATVGPLFRSYQHPTRGLKQETLTGYVAEWLRVAGVKRVPRDGVGAHSLRHTAASDVLDRCNDLRVVQEMLGHERLSTTSIYLRRAGIGQLREAMAGRDYLSTEFQQSSSENGSH